MAPARTSLKAEAARKGIHLTTGLVPLVYACGVPRGWILALLAVMCAAMLTLEFARRGENWLGRAFARWFGFMLRRAESDKRRWLGATHYCIAAFLCILFFSKPIAVLAILFMSVGDTAASIVGMVWGRTRIGGKSLEGTLAFWAAASLVALAAHAADPAYPLAAGLVTAPVAALAELFIPRLDDNLTIPLVSGVCLWMISMVGIQACA